MEHYKDPFIISVALAITFLIGRIALWDCLHPVVHLLGVGVGFFGCAAYINYRKWKS